MCRPLRRRVKDGTDDPRPSCPAKIVEIAEDLGDWRMFVGEIVEIGDTGLMMTVMMDFHGQGVDMRLERVGRVGEGIDPWAATQNVAPQPLRGEHPAKRIEYVRGDRQTVSAVEVTKLRWNSTRPSSKSDLRKKSRAAEKPPLVFSIRAGITRRRLRVALPSSAWLRGPRRSPGRPPSSITASCRDRRSRAA